MYKLLVFLCVVALVCGGRLPKLNRKGKPLQLKPRHGTRIVGGTEIPITDAPYFAQIEFGDLFWAAGVILNQNHILTTAFFVNGVLPDNLVVRAGSASLGRNGSVHNVTDIRIHDDFDGIFLNDVAILTISPDLEYDETIQNITLASVEPTNGTIAKVVGLGSDDSTILTPVDNLLGTDMQLLDRDTCTLASATQICGGDDSNGPCVYDEGSPVVVNGELVAIVDDAFYCGTVAEIPNLLNSIPTMKDWIDANI